MTSNEYPRAFSQHGVYFTGASGKEAIGCCPFCGKEKHFYVNTENHKWSCKACQKQGGFQTFLRLVYERANTDDVKELAVERGLRAKTLLTHGVKSWHGHFLFPVWMRDGTDKLHDLRHYRPGGKTMTTAGCTAALWRWERLDGQPREVWIAEGEWDALALLEAGVRGEVVSVPGAGVWKAEWSTLLLGCKVHLCYDNDPAGVDGAYKAYRGLHGHAETIDVIRWPKGIDVGWDVRDEYTKHGAEKFEQRVRAMFNPFPAGADSLTAVLTLPSGATKNPLAKGMRETASPEKPTGDATRIDPEKVYEAYRKWLWLPDPVVLDIVFGCCIANRMQGDPLWLFLVAPPGGTKTEILISLEQCANIVGVTTITPAGLVSGASFAGGADPSLFAQFQGELGKILVVKDFTTVLKMPDQPREELFGNLRDAYDGKFEKMFGNGVHRRYVMHFGMIAGVTPVIEQYMEQSVGLGERFMTYRVPIPAGMAAQREFLRAAQRNVGREIKMRAELQSCAYAVLKYDYLKHHPSPRVPDSIKDQLIHAAQVVSLVRGSVTRDKYSKEVTHKPFCELGTRLVKQLTKWTISVALFHGRNTASPVDYATAVRMAVGSCPSGALAFLRGLYSDGGKSWTTDELATIAGLPAFPTGERILENMSLLGAVDQQKVQGLKVRNVWGMNAELREAIDASGVFN